MTAPWIVLHEGHRLRWGGDLRRHHLLLELARRTDAALVDGFSPSVVRAVLHSNARSSWRFWRPRARVASAEVLSPTLAEEVRHEADAFLLDVHDDPIAQHAAFGIPLAADRRAELEAQRTANLDAFRWLAAPTASFAELAGLDTERLLVAPNGTDTRHILPLPPPEAPVVGMVSGAAPQRGIETLVRAAGIVRNDEPELRLRLWLSATGDASEAFLAGLRRSLEGQPWIAIESAPYASLGETLAEAAVLCVPHPPGAYMDSALPVKLLDSMAAGRPVVVTPRVECKALVERVGSGLVAADDSPEALAEAILRLLRDPALSRRLGASGRAAAEAEFDWRVIGARLADAILQRAR